MERIFGDTVPLKFDLYLQILVEKEHQQLLKQENLLLKSHLSQRIQVLSCLELRCFLSADMSLAW